MELIAIIVAGLLGWQHGTFGRRELRIMALVVIGWSAVTSAASVPYLTLESLGFGLLYHALIVTVPYALGALARRVSGRRR
jgi:cytochrome bd-type quinol oxidase subunit 1